MDIGEFALPAADPLFMIDLSVQAEDLQANWGRCNMLANYLAEYVAYQFSEREWAENLISTVTNEFLEAVAQTAPPGTALALSCRQYDGLILLDLAHALRPDVVVLYMTFLSSLYGSTIDSLYFAHLTAAERPTPAFNQLGILMLVHDFHVRVAARLEPPTGQIAVRISIPTQEITP
ncbi:hypothetical protein K2Z83_13820 [Oscillochloris sp. ZM17-4]|uniref:hypothetical protein n=1 Tax=Oscillochloris sp. ZM17-4 TaxID=2866714 RepID=UPI001C732E24|nr:hypothetical protein [Oscillochloris sp. ZM17-4]MBX0328752.1 hypothetical protein [Oscillochloris sp. ZM17-4]